MTVFDICDDINLKSIFHVYFYRNSKENVGVSVCTSARRHDEKVTISLFIFKLLIVFNNNKVNSNYILYH